MMAQKTTITAAILYSATHNLSDSESGTAVIVGVGLRVMVVVRRNDTSSDMEKTYHNLAQP